VNEKYLQKAAKLLEDCGLRKTHPRLALLCVLFQTDYALTSEQIYEQLDCSTDKATVYRTLLVFLRHNIVHQAYIRDRRRHFELANYCKPDQCHPHFTCRSCGRTICLRQVVVPAVQNIPDGFLVLHRQIRLEGLCDECSGNSPQ
jgi:Fur family ferric uptake transcriptional regulator